MIQFLPANDRLAQCLEYYGDYLPQQVDIAKSLLKPGAVVVVLSANIGWHAIALATVIEPDGQVLAIERSPAVRRILMQNLAANEVQCVTVMPAAAASKSIDDLEFERVDLVLINSREEATSVIEGGAETLRRHAPVLMFLEQPREGLSALDKRMAALGYRCWTVESPFFDPGNFNGRDVDIFRGECSYALVALPRDRETPDHIRSLSTVSRLPR
jgi:precorrin-6B methylase 2